MAGLKIPFFGLKKQYDTIRQEILDVTDEVLQSGDLMGGNHTSEFESWIARKNNSKYAVTCHSGTQALEIIASYYKRPYDRPRVLVPAMTYVASANAFMRTGWDIKLVDTDYYGIMDPKQIDRRDYEAICMVGLHGAAISPQWNHLTDCLIEDGAQHWLSDNCLRQGAATAVSFDPTKNFNNYGNGGAVVTNVEELADYARNWKAHGHPSNHAEIGTNSRMSEVDCAQMMVKSRHLDNWQLRRKTIAAHWWSRLADDTRVRCLIDHTNFDQHCFFKFVIEIDNRDLVQQKLKQLKIETRVHYKDPLHELPAYQHLQGPSILSSASSLSRRCLSLPMYPELTDLEVDYIIDSLLDCV
jgi:dTDP-4-amino-4,6-dideoxygalactose transaminase